MNTLEILTKIARFTWTATKWTIKNIYLLIVGTPEQRAARKQREAQRLKEYELKRQAYNEEYEREQARLQAREDAQRQDQNNWKTGMESMIKW